MESLALRECLQAARRERPKILPCARVTLNEISAHQFGQSLLIGTEDDLANTIRLAIGVAMLDEPPTGDRGSAF
jgi:hypothetical protein